LSKQLNTRYYNLTKLTSPTLNDLDIGALPNPQERRFVLQVLQLSKLIRQLESFCFCGSDCFCPNHTYKKANTKTGIRFIKNHDQITSFAKATNTCF